MEVYQDQGAVIKSWAVNPEQGAIDQAINLSRLPFVISHIALMPDAHHGYGMPIGGVLFTDNVVVPYAVGSDIGCGVQLIETNLTDANLVAEKLEEFLTLISKLIPTGNGFHGDHGPDRIESFELTDFNGSNFAQQVIMGADKQCGTLGGGNHFLELQRSNDGRFWFMLHSGSRSVGKKICDYWLKIAQGLNKKWYSYASADRYLAYLPMDSDEGQGYWNDMTIALAWAEENRRRMANKVMGAFSEIFDADAWVVTDVHHNYATRENHGKKNGIIHRKGAVRANAGEMVLIPGSMGTSSWVAEGLGNPQAFNTCQHGAGRARSRKSTRESTNVEEMNAQLESVGVTLVTRDRGSVIDESAIAYKSIDAVMEASTELIKPIMQLWPIGVVKG